MSTAAKTKQNLNEKIQAVSSNLSFFNLQKESLFYPLCFRTE
jgi:hypothetical protein